MTMPLVERFLAGFHDRAPGGSSRAFGGLVVHDERTGRQHADSYQALASALAEATLPPGPLLDLACGDGALLARLLAATGRPCLGVDLSAGELAAARTRLGPTVPLHQARAQALPLADGSIAAITCHMALMLMVEPEAVVAELARVLVPGGRLLALVPAAPADGRPDPVTTAYIDALAGHARRADWQALRFEGRRWREPDSLAALLQPAFGSPRTRRLVGQQHFSPDQAWAWFTDLYDLHLLPPAAWPAVQAGFHARLAPLRDTAGQVSLPHAYYLIDATTAS